MVTNKDILESIGTKIKKARLEKNLTQNSLAEQVEISTDLLRNIENGRNIGSVATLINLCNSLDITTDFLFADLLTSSNNQIDNTLYSNFQKLSSSDREVLKQIIIHLDKKY